MIDLVEAAAHRGHALVSRARPALSSEVSQLGKADASSAWLRSAHSSKKSRYTNGSAEGGLRTFRNEPSLTAFTKGNEALSLMEYDLLTVPQQYTQASQEFERFLLDAREALGHHSTHVTYTTVQAVLLTFRRRLIVRDALRIADSLPAVLRAIFVSEWDTDVPPIPFGSRAEHVAEAKEFRRNHSFVPDDAIAIVGCVLSRHVERKEICRVLADLPMAARNFWAGSPLAD